MCWCHDGREPEAHCLYEMGLRFITRINTKIFTSIFNC